MAPLLTMLPELRTEPSLTMVPSLTRVTPLPTNRVFEVPTVQVVPGWIVQVSVLPTHVPPLLVQTEPLELSLPFTASEADCVTVAVIAELNSKAGTPQVVE